MGGEDKGGAAKKGEGSEKRGERLARKTDMGIRMRKHVYQ